MKIHQQNACSVLNMIIQKESHSCEKMWFYLYLFSPKIGLFVKVISRYSHQCSYDGI